MSEPERICRQCPEDQRHERRVMLGQESPSGQTWYLCVKHWLDWDRDERFGTRLVGVSPPPADQPPVISGSSVDVSGPPVASTTISMPGVASAGTERERATTKPKRPAKPRSQS